MATLRSRRVSRALYLAHAAGSDGGQDFVRAEPGAWGDGQAGEWRIISGESRVGSGF
jgi:hypothetical protein